MNLCVVLGPVKSGTTMLISLLDGHPNLAAFPLEVKFLTHWFERLSKEPQSYQSLNNFFLLKSKIKLMDGEYQKNADIMNSGRIDFKGFDFDQFAGEMTSKEGCEARSQLSGAQLFRQYLEDIHDCLNQIISTGDYKWIVSKEGNHGIKHRTAIDELIPGTRYIVVVRDPRDVYASFKQIAEKKRRGVMTPTFKELITPARFILDNNGKNFTAFEQGFCNLYTDSERYLFLRYEDIVTEPRNQLMRVAEFLEIPFNTSMLQPTNLKNDWGGNSSSLKSFSGLTQSRARRWDTELSLSEKRLIQYFLSRYISEGKYDRAPSHFSRTRIIVDAMLTEWSEGVRYRRPAVKRLRENVKSFIYLARMIGLCLKARKP